MDKLLPLFLAIVGLAAGAGYGYISVPGSDADATETADDAPDKDSGPEEAGKTESDYFELENQFVVPLVSGERVGAMVVLSLGLEVSKGRMDPVRNAEPRLRDAFLGVLFEHANSDGFGANMTESKNMRALRQALLEAARGVLDDAVVDVLILDLARRDA